MELLKSFSTVSYAYAFIRTSEGKAVEKRRIGNVKLMPPHLSPLPKGERILMHS